MLNQVTVLWMNIYVKQFCGGWDMCLLQATGSWMPSGCWLHLEVTNMKYLAEWYWVKSKEGDSSRLAINKLGGPKPQLRLACTNFFPETSHVTPKNLKSSPSWFISLCRYHIYIVICFHICIWKQQLDFDFHLQNLYGGRSRLVLKCTFQKGSTTVLPARGVTRKWFFIVKKQSQIFEFSYILHLLKCFEI